MCYRVFVANTLQVNAPNPFVGTLTAVVGSHRKWKLLDFVVSITYNDSTSWLAPTSSLTPAPASRLNRKLTTEEEEPF